MDTWLNTMSVVGLAISVAACAKPTTEMLAQDQEACRQFGFQPESLNFAHCVLQQQWPAWSYKGRGYLCCGGAATTEPR